MSGFELLMLLKAADAAAATGSITNPDAVSSVAAVGPPAQNRELSLTN
jgi:hypothetical protein